jgi:hypothetical protein
MSIQANHTDELDKQSQNIQATQDIQPIQCSHTTKTSHTTQASQYQLLNTTNSQTNFHNTQYHKYKNDYTVDYRYICIKKDLFDVNLVQLNYSNIKYNNYIEIIYKSPTILLEGLFFKTPPISANYISIYTKDKQYTNTHSNTHTNYNNNNISIKLLLNQKEHPQFIQILRSIDEYISGYINRFSAEIDKEMHNEDSTSTESRTIAMLRYEQIIKYNTNYSRYANSYANGGSHNHTSTLETQFMYLKSYLDKAMISELEKKISDKKYIFTFNISNIYFGNNTLIPLIKCNRCEVVY